jgi:PKD repeat protein
VSGRARAVVAALIGALIGAAPLPASAVPASLGLEVTQPAFVGEEFLAQSDAIETTGGRDNWTCHVDFGDGTTGGYWRAHSYDAFAPCAAFHDYTVAGTYTVAMTVTDAVGGTVSEQQQVTVTSRLVMAVQAGVEGTRAALSGPEGEAHVQWSLGGEGTDAACDIASPTSPDTMVTCYRDGTYRVLYDTGSAATSGAYDLTWTNGAPRPTVRVQRTMVGADGNTRYVPVTRVGTGDQVRFDVRAHDPSTHGTQGDPLKCVFDHGNGLRESQTAYGPRGSCNGQTSYLAPGRHTSEVRVVDDDRAVGKARASIVVVRRDVHLAVRDIKRGGTRGVVRASLTPRGLQGRMALTFPNGQSLVATRLTSIQVTSFGSVSLLGRARVDGRTGYRFVVFPESKYVQGIAFAAYAWKVGHRDEYVVDQVIHRDQFRVRLQAPPVR